MEFYIQWHITAKCNLNCLHCYKEPQRNDLKYEEVKLVADNLIDFAKKSDHNLIITLTGGEPFLKDEVYQISKYLDLQKEVKEINFISNGTLIPDFDELNSISKLGILNVSLECDDETVNDSIRGYGSFSKVKKNLEVLKEKFNIGLMITLMNKNIDKITANFNEIDILFDDFGLKQIIFERFIPVGHAKHLKNEVVSKEKLLGLYEILAEFYDVYYEDIKNYKAIKVINNNGTREIFGGVCVVGKDGCAVLSDATVYPCRRLNISLGNLLSEDLNDILLSFDIANKIKNTDYLGCYAMSYAINNQVCNAGLQ